MAAELESLTNNESMNRFQERTSLGHMSSLHVGACEYFSEGVYNLHQIITAKYLL